MAARGNRSMKIPALRPSARCLAALIASLVVTTLLSDPKSAEPRNTPTPTIHVLAAWIRWLPAGVPAAGYLTLANTGTKTLILRSASSPAYADVSIHRTVTHAGVEEMRPVTDLKLAPHQTLPFESTGYHLMLMEPRDPAPAIGTTVPITLHFSDGSILTVPFEVRKAGGTSNP